MYFSVKTTLTCCRYRGCPFQQSQISHDTHVTGIHQYYLDQLLLCKNIINKFPCTLGIKPHLNPAHPCSSIPLVTGSDSLLKIDS